MPNGLLNWRFNKRKQMRSILSRIAIGFTLTVVLITLSSCATTYLGRYLAWGTMPNLERQKQFPVRPVTVEETAFIFARDETGERRFREEFQSIRYRNKKREEIEVDFDTFLEETETFCFIVIRDDAIVYESYLDGYSRNSLIPTFSVAKSVTSALVGIALKKGLIGSPADPVTKYIPELADPRFDDVTIEHLLAMNSGLKHSFGFAPWNDFIRSYFHPNIKRVALNQRFSGSPGEFFTYNNSHTQLLGMILERVSGEPPAVFLEKHLWIPVGMEYPASWSMDSEEHGFEQMAVGINARPLDYAKFGRLFLHEGKWQDEQIIPGDWVHASTHTDLSHGNLKEYYGTKEKTGFHEFFVRQGGYYSYHWWGYRTESERNDFFASGMFGQYIYVSPGTNTIICRFGKDEGDVFWWPEILKNLTESL